MKRKAFILALLTSVTLTGCNFQFNQSQVGKDFHSITKELTDELSGYVDGVDSLTGELNGLFSDLQDISEEYGLELEKAALVRVVDGDTIVVELDEEEYKVRLIGIDTPESVASEEYLNRTGKENTKEGFDASQFTKDLLDDYEYVYLESDVSDTDRYGRLLRYVWVEVPEDYYNKEEIASKMLNGILLANHVAIPVEYKPDTKYAEEFTYIYENEDYEK